MTGTKRFSRCGISARAAKRRAYPTFRKPNITRRCTRPARTGSPGKNRSWATIPASRGDKFAHNCVAAVEQPNAFKDYADPEPDRRYKMVTFIGDPREARGYYTLISRDGLDWKVYSPSPIAPSRDNINCFYDARRGLYIVYPKIGTKIRGHERRVYYVMASKNFRQWTRPVLSFVPDLRDDVGALSRLEASRDVLNAGINPKQIRSEFYGLGFYQTESCTLAFPWVLTVNDNDKFGNQDGISEIQLAVSHDLIGWDRPFRLPCIPQGNPGEWDCGFITTANEALRVGDEIWLYYSGSNYSHGCPCFYENENSGQGTRYTASIGLARWKLDRFVSVDGPGEGATLDTIALEFSGKRLEINAAVKPGGSLTVQVLDAGGRPIPGFGISESLNGRRSPSRGTLEGKRESRVPGGQAGIASVCHEPCGTLFLRLQGELMTTRISAILSLLFVLACRSGSEPARPSQRRPLSAPVPRARSASLERRSTAGSRRTVFPPPTTSNTGHRQRMDWPLPWPTFRLGWPPTTTRPGMDRATAWETWLTRTHFPSGGHSGGFARFAEPSKDDRNHDDGIGTLHLVKALPTDRFKGSSSALGGGDPDLRGARVSVWVRGNEFRPNGAELLWWTQSQSNIDSGFSGAGWRARQLGLHGVHPDGPCAGWAMAPRRLSAAERQHSLDLRRKQPDAPGPERAALRILVDRPGAGAYEYQFLPPAGDRRP